MSTESTPPVDPEQPSYAGGETPGAVPPPPPGSPATPAAPSGPPSSYQAPGAAISPAQERNWAMISHLIPIVASILSAGTLGFVASLIVYLVYKDKGPFVRRFSANALNIQLMELIVVLISIPLLFVLIGFITLPLAIIVAVIFHIIAAVKANQGEWYDPPMVPRFVK